MFLHIKQNNGQRKKKIEQEKRSEKTRNSRDKSTTSRNKKEENSRDHFSNSQIKRIFKSMRLNKPKVFENKLKGKFIFS